MMHQIVKVNGVRVFIQSVDVAVAFADWALAQGFKVEMSEGHPVDTAGDEQASAHSLTEMYARSLA